MKPKDQRVGMNGIATFECQASGNPPPSVFWTKEGSQELMFAGTTHGQMFVSEDGTLTIQVQLLKYLYHIPESSWSILISFSTVLPRRRKLCIVEYVLPFFC